MRLASRQTLLIAGLVIAAIFTYLGLQAFWLEPASLTVQEYSLQLPHWPQELSGLRVAALADLHVGSPFNGLDKLPRIVEETNALHPDLIVLLGDYVIGGVPGGTHVPAREFAPALSHLHAPLGVWGVMGNHDWWEGFTPVSSQLEAAGIPMLEDRAVRLESGSGSFWLAGVSDFWEGRHDVTAAIQNVTDRAPLIVITHNPDIFPDVPGRVSLTIAGHTHGGQVRLPFIGAPIIPSEYGQRFAAGHIVEDGRHLLVSPGLGTSILPVRFRVPPEISLLTLRP